MIRMDYNRQEVEGQLRQARRQLRPVLRKWGRLAGATIAAGARGRMRNAKGEGDFRPGGGPLRVHTGRLMQSLSNRRAEGFFEKVLVQGTRVTVTKGSNLPYAAIHEYGGQVPVTPRMRRYFWARWYETRDERWKALAITKKQALNIPARPYLNPGLQAVLPKLEDMLAEMLEDVLQQTIGAP